MPACADRSSCAPECSTTGAALLHYSKLCFVWLQLHFWYSGHFQFATAKRRLMTSSALTWIIISCSMLSNNYLNFVHFYWFLALFPTLVVQSRSMKCRQCGVFTLLSLVNSTLNLDAIQSILLQLHIIWCLQKSHCVLSFLRKKVFIP